MHVPRATQRAAVEPNAPLADDPPPIATCQQAEMHRLEVLHQRQLEWISAPDEMRDIARQRFMNALDTFNLLVSYDKLLDT